MNSWLDIFCAVAILDQKEEIYETEDKIDKKAQQYCDVFSE